MPLIYHEHVLVRYMCVSGDILLEIIITKVKQSNYIITFALNMQCMGVKCCTQKYGKKYQYWLKLHGEMCDAQLKGDLLKITEIWYQM